MSDHTAGVPQMTPEEAIAFHDSGEWKDWTHEQIFKKQIHQTCLCVPFDRFHEATEKTMGRPVFTHEFARPDLLIQEHLGITPPATFADVMDKLPKDKPVIMVSR